jgi:putative aminopeptidase FrvX
MLLGGRGLITPDAVLRWTEETAAKAQIAYQRDVSSGGTADAMAINLTRAAASFLYPGRGHHRQKAWNQEILYEH